MTLSHSFQTKGTVITLSGPSGVGKGTVISKLMEKNPELMHSVSVTTRAPRAGEQNGVDYHFVAKNVFEMMIKNDEVLEYDIYCDHYYGTLKAPLTDCVEKGIDIIMDITVPGSISVMESFPESTSIFLLPPSYSELKRRLQNRGTETPQALEKRLRRAISEIGKAQLFDYLLVNDDLEETTESILAIIKVERLRYKRMKGIENKVMEI
jgi:guanylate kinase